MRHQKYDAAFILKGAYRLALKKGVDSVTSRGLAHELGISTQPIYLSFQNIEEVKELLSEQIFRDIQGKHFQAIETMQDFLTNYSRFIQEEKELYFVLTADQRMQTQSEVFLYRFFEDCLSKEYQLRSYEKQILFSRMQGMISVLIKSGELTEKIHLLEEMILSDIQLIVDSRRTVAMTK
ncbi:hypothetical protein BAU15_03500 [Enterococcus sp. JM4C]|uniref:TetR family transcriptional regulator n=1 Tax=Candidatus Enterococcus huntleyi TaxID=1857217 RepID=UPI001379E6F0|nr:TetR family transcriptional regulator [Enterococcus sp. JM4C]KAF1295618.1 hypothetical protein BAU15_03500 [Enterococcus sp. JM4C]